MDYRTYSAIGRIARHEKVRQRLEARKRTKIERVARGIRLAILIPTALMACAFFWLIGYMHAEISCGM